ncbi:MAG: DEAD/DEAH box helicase, partial [candidate division WOR-3 bacterium]
MPPKLTIGPRYVKQDKDGLRLFQKKTLEVINNSEVKIILVEAPVGSGKSYIISKLLESEILKRKPLVLTYPTKILMESQVAAIVKGIGAKNVGLWPYTAFLPNKLNIFLYSTDSLCYAVKNMKNVKLDDRGYLLKKLFFDIQWHSKNSAVVTSPDVLFLLYSREVYGGSKEIQNALSNAIIFFDEFHVYSELSNFPLLIRDLLSKNVSKIILLSATPFESAELKRIEKEYPTVKITFESSIGTEHDFIFNYPIDFMYDTFKVTDIRETSEKII